jgi:hypothetical protein
VGQVGCTSVLCVCVYVCGVGSGRLCQAAQSLCDVWKERKVWKGAVPFVLCP